MRALIVILCCCAVAIALQGCGTSRTCMASQFNLVSQSISGSLSGSVSVTVTMSTTMTTTMQISGQFTEKLDLEDFNMYFENGQDVVLDKPMKINMHVETKGLLIASDKKAVTLSKVTNKTDGKVLSDKCLVYTVPAMPAPATLSLGFQAVMATVREATTCGGNDGTHDTWNIAKKYDGPVPSVPGMPPPSNISKVSGSFSEKVVMTKDSLLASSSGEVQAKVLGDHDKVILDMDTKTDMQVTHVKAGGPSKIDLDYSTWGDCEPVPHDVDLDHIFDAPVEGFRVQQTFFQQHVISTIRVAMQAERTSAQSVVV